MTSHRQDPKKDAGTKGSPRSFGTRAVVTGAGSGIGRALALELARRGGSVVCADVDRAGAEATVRAVASVGGRARAVECDVARETDVRQLADEAAALFAAPVDLVVNNAGIGAGGARIGETSLDDWRRTIDVNLWGVIHGCHVFAPLLRASGRGGIVNVASAASFAAGPRMAAYNVSKAGVLALSETLAAELAGTGVQVTVLDRRPRHRTARVPISQNVCYVTFADDEQDSDSSLFRRASGGNCVEAAYAPFTSSMGPASRS